MLNYIATFPDLFYICGMKTKQIVDGYDIRFPKSEYLKDISTSIGERRKMFGLTQESLGTMLGMDKSQICKLEKGGNPTVDSIVKVFDAMGCSVKVIVEDNINEEFVVPQLIMSVSSFAKKHSLLISQAYHYLNNLGGIGYFLNNAEALLSLPEDTIIEDLELVCRRRGGLL